MRRKLGVTMFRVLGYALGLMGAAAVQAGPHLTVYTEDNPPYSFQEGGVIKGSATTVVKAVLDHAKIDYSIELVPWARAYNAASTEANVMIYSIARVPPRETSFKWIGPVTDTDQIYFYKLKSDHTTSLKTPQDARKFGLIVPRDGYEQHMADFLKIPTILLAPNEESAVSMLFAKRAPLLLLGSDVIGDLATKTGNNKEALDKLIPGFTSQGYFAVSKGTPDSVAKALRDSYETLSKQKAIPKFK